MGPQRAWPERFAAASTPATVVSSTIAASRISGVRLPLSVAADAAAEKTFPSFVARDADLPIGFDEGVLRFVLSGRESVCCGAP